MHAPLRKMHSRHDSRPSLAEFENASVCRIDAQNGYRFEVTGAGTVAPEDMRRLGSNTVVPI